MSIKDAAKPYIDAGHDKKLNSLRRMLGEIENQIESYGETDPAIYFDINEIQKLWIATKGRKYERLILKESQRRVLDLINDQLAQRIPVRMILLKARRFGGSTLLTALTYILVRDYGYKATIVGHEVRAAENLYKMIKLFHSRDPKMTEKPEIRNKRELIFPSGGEVWIATAGKDEIERSQTNQVVLATEYAMWPRPVELMTGLKDTVSDDNPNTFFFIESTAKGASNDFHDRWIESERGFDEYNNPIMWKGIFIGWQHNHEEYFTNFDSEYARKSFEASMDDEEQSYLNDGTTLEQLHWRRNKITSMAGADRNVKIQNFRQEYPGNAAEAFLSTGRPKFSQIVLAEWYRNAKDFHPPIFIGDCNYNESIRWEDVPHHLDTLQPIAFTAREQGALKIWEWPKPDTDYELGADVAEGIQKKDKTTDESAIAIRRRDNGLYVATWHGFIHPESFADLITSLARAYGEAYVCVESNSMGGTTIARLTKAYPLNRIYKDENLANVAYPEEADRYGFRSTKPSKPLLLNNLAYSIRSRTMVLYDLTAINELMRAVVDDRGLVETKGLDLLTAIALAEKAHISTTDYHKRTEEENLYDRYKRELRERDRRAEAMVENIRGKNHNEGFLIA